MDKLRKLIREEIKYLNEGINPKLVDSYKKWVKVYHDFNNDVEFAEDPSKLLHYFKTKLNRLYSSYNECLSILKHLYKNVAPNPLWKQFGIK